MSQSAKTIVGDGWAALAQVAKWVAAGENVEWNLHQGSHIELLHPSVDGWEVAEDFSSVCKSFGIESGAWQQSPLTVEARGKQWVSWNHESLEELDPTEAPMAVREEVVFERPLRDLLTALRKSVLASPHVTVKDQPDIEAVDVRAGVFRAQERKKLKPYGLLQLQWDHVDSLFGSEIRPHQAMWVSLTRDAGEENQHRALGWLHGDLRSSLWSAVLSSEDLEDNHAIVRRIRKIKQAISKMTGKESFENERVLVLSDFFVREMPKHKASGNQGRLIVDGLGWSSAWRQANAETEKSQAHGALLTQESVLTPSV